MRGSASTHTQLENDVVPTEDPALRYQLQAMQDLRAAIDADPVPDGHKLAALKDMEDSLCVHQSAALSASNNQHDSSVDTDHHEFIGNLMSQLGKGKSDIVQLEQIQNELLHLRAELVAQHTHQAQP